MPSASGSRTGHRPTIDDVARRARVAKGTVSKALGPRAGSSEISVATRERICAIATAMGYEPDWKRRAAATRRSKVIGLAFADYAPPGDHLHGSLVHALARQAVERGYALAFVPMIGDAGKWHQRLRQQDLDALVMMAPMPECIAATLAGLGRPAVVVNAATDALVPHLLLDEAAIAKDLALHLHGLGHRHIAYAMMTRHGRHYSESARQAGMVDAARSLGMSCETIIDLFPRLLPRLRAGRATAVVAYNSHDGLRLLRECLRSGLAVPGDLSLCSFDSGSPNEWMVPAVTSGEHPNIAIAQRAIELLVGMIEGWIRPSQRAGRILFPSMLRVRESTGAPR